MTVLVPNLLVSCCYCVFTCMHRQILQLPSGFGFLLLSKHYFAHHKIFRHTSTNHSALCQKEKAIMKTEKHYNKNPKDRNYLSVASALSPSTFKILSKLVESEEFMGVMPNCIPCPTLLGQIMRNIRLRLRACK